jgi:type I restriction-modification system DNA methylase subunit
LIWGTQKVPRTFQTSLRGYRRAADRYVLQHRHFNYVWILTNHKAPQREGKIQLINAAEFYQKMRKSLGSKRKELSDTDIARIVALYRDFTTNEHSRIFDNEDFGYSTITIE